MFVKITRSGSRRYVQLVESYRDDAGRVKKRTVATLGRLDQLGGELDAVINGLLKVSGRSPQAPPAIEFESARALGDVWALSELWKALGFEGLARVFRSRRYAMAVEALIRVMVLNRLCNPDSKLGVLRWLQTVAVPGIDTARVTHQQLLRSMDALIDHQAKVDKVLAGLLRPLIDQALSVVFYDLTTLRAEGLSELEGDVRQHGKAKEGMIARQFMLGVVQTAEGLPLYHEVFAGNTAETKTLMPTLAKVLERFPSVRRLILVADRGLLSLDNLAELRALRLSNGQPLEFILAVPGRRYSEFAGLLECFHRRQCLSASEEVVGELGWQDLRLIVAHDPQAAQLQSRRRAERIAELEATAAHWVGTLEQQDEGVRRRGRKLSDSGAKARFYHAVCEAQLAKIIRVDLKGPLFSYEIGQDALALAEMMDGKLLLVTNAAELSPAQVVSRYKSLADIERGFRVLKSEIEIAPVYHRLPERIRAHASICFIALILYRVMRQRLRAAHTGISPERALQSLRRIQHHRVRLNAAQPIAGISSISPAQKALFSALNVSQPVASRQMPLL